VKWKCTLACSLKLERIEVGGAVKKIDSDESLHRDADTAKIVVDRLPILPTGIRPPSTYGGAIPPSW
jgi:hypothetical protein